MSPVDDAWIRLVVPADARFARVARLTAASFVATWGADLDDVEDLRIVVDELVTALAAVSSNAEIELALAMGDGDLRAECSTQASSMPRLDDLTRQIVSGVVDQLTEHQADGRARFVLRKRLAQPVR